MITKKTGDIDMFKLRWICCSYGHDMSFIDSNASVNASERVVKKLQSESKKGSPIGQKPFSSSEAAFVFW
jgi:hypothetical protein